MLVDEGYNEDELQTVPESTTVSVSGNWGPPGATIDVHALSNSHRSGWSIAFRCSYVLRLNRNPFSTLG